MTIQTQYTKLKWKIAVEMFEQTHQLLYPSVSKNKPIDLYAA